jgi:SulP family sulfate permease
MAQAVEVEKAWPLAEEDRADNCDESGSYAADLTSDPDVVIFRISGAFFFGAAAAVAAALDRIGEHPKAYVIDFCAVHILGSTAAETIDGFVDKAQRHGTAVYIAGAMPRVRRVLLVHGAKPPQVRFKRAVADAVLTARGRIAFEDRLREG